MKELLKKVKIRMGITDGKQDEKIIGYIELFQNKIKSVCKRHDFPKELNYMCIDFASKCYLYYLNKDNTNNEKLQVSSATDSGQKVDFKTVETISKDDVDINKVINRNIAEIREYAYMEWRDYEYTNRI